MSEFIGGALAGELTDHSSRGAHVTRRVGVELGELVVKLAVVGVVHQAGPVHDHFLMILKARCPRNDLVLHGLQLAIRRSAEPDGLQRMRAINQRERLVPREIDAHGTLQRLGGHHCEEKLVLRTQAGTEPAADKAVDEPHVMGLEIEDLRDILLRVIRTLGLVVNRELPVIMPVHGGGVRLDGVVVLDGTGVVGLKPDRRRAVGRCKVPTRVRRRRDAVTLLGWLVGRCFGLMEIGLVRLFFVADLYQRSRVARRLEAFAYDKRDGLQAEEDPIGRERLEVLSGRCCFVVVVLGIVGEWRAVLVREDLDEAGDLASFRRIDGDNAALRDSGVDEVAVEQARNVVFRGILGLAGDLQRAIDAAGWCANVRLGSHERVSRRALARQRG